MSVKCGYGIKTYGEAPMTILVRVIAVPLMVV